MSDSKNESRPDHGSSGKSGDADAMERMNKALKVALDTPPKTHKDEPKRRSGAADLKKDRSR